MKYFKQFALLSLSLLAGCSVSPAGEINNASNNNSEILEKESSLTCHDAFLSFMSQDGFTRTGDEEMIWTRGGRNSRPQVVIDFTNRFIQLNNPEFSYGDFTIKPREDFETDEEYLKFNSTAYVDYKYDAAEDNFMNFTNKESDEPSAPRNDIEQELRAMYEKYVGGSSLLGCESIESLPWRRFEKLKEVKASPVEGLLINSSQMNDSKPEVKQPVDMSKEFVEVNSIDEFLTYAKGKYIPAYENIGKATQMNSFKKVGVNLLILDADKVNAGLAESDEISPQFILDYIRDSYFPKSEFLGDYLVFLRLKEGDIEKIEESIPTFELDEVMTLLTIPSSSDGNIAISQSITDNYSIMTALNDSLAIDGVPSHELLAINNEKDEAWLKLFGIYEK